MSVRLSSTDLFADRHIGPSDSEVQEMLAVLGLDSLESLIDQTLPPSIRMSGDLQLPEALTERQLLARATDLANKNTIFRSYIGMGYSGTITPPAVQRGILENPSWYTQYTPY
ncbi:MAG: glycine dehydrogenase (aminomethyl-transferring), partial [Bacteroidetes Order II. Incertae sedis bacterium]|nr:glycine dehydrogenase (aminomethyl-transferring) [Bacteroidetes Order II. bacterium]